MSVGLNWVVLLFHVPLVMYGQSHGWISLGTHLCASPGLEYQRWPQPHVWSLGADLWLEQPVLFHKDYLFLHVVFCLLFSPGGRLPRERYWGLPVFLKARTRTGNVASITCYWSKQVKASTDSEGKREAASCWAEHSAYTRMARLLVSFGDCWIAGNLWRQLTTLGSWKV